MSEKNYKKLLGISIPICYFVIAIFCVFCFGLSKVQAKSYTWSQPTMMSFHTTRGNFTSLKSCTGVNECFYSDNGDMVANFASSRYQFSRSLTDASQFAEQNTYSLSVRFRIVTLDEIDKTNTNVTMYYYPDNSSNYSLATCDGTQELTISKNSDYDYYVTYKCNEFTINRDISHMGLMIGGYPNSIYFVQMAQNLQLIGPGEATNDDIINNQNQNTQDIINNQNQNADKITQNQDKNTDKQIQENRNLLQQLFDFLVGLFIPDSFDFLTGFLDVLEQKLGFVGSVPIQFFEFLIELVNVDFETITSITLPEFDVFGYTFFEEQEIDLTEIMEVFAPYRIYTNIGCVCLCIRYLIKLYETFANGEE